MEEFRECADINEGSRYKHERTIVHIDLDCFYAQVEELKNPELSTKPVGIKQQHYVITSNYVAREYGVKKCMLITEALTLCPKLILINGEDLHDYRIMSTKVSDIIKQFSSKVEKLGLDENFVDVSHLVEVRMNSGGQKIVNSIQGHIYKNEIEVNCGCGCRDRLTVGSHIAEEIRNKIREVIGLTCCAGIAHNKLLAKLVCSTHKPNQQTTVFPCSASTLISNLNHVRSIPGIGRKTSDILEALGVCTITDLQNSSLNQLEKHLGKPLASWIKGACFGVDDSDVKESGKQQIIGLEEAAKMIATIEEVQKRISSLVERGLILIDEDGRYPTALRVTVRKYSSSEEYSRQRESKQCAINSSLFKSKAKEEICEIALGLFKQIVDSKKPFHLTLIGIAFTKFVNVLPAKSSLLKFMDSKYVKKSSKCLPGTSVESEDIYDKNNKPNNIPSEKSGSPAILPLKLSHIDKSVLDELPPDIKAEILQTYSEENTNPSTSQGYSRCPPGVDVSVFNELPLDIQMELLKESETNNSNQSTSKKQKSIFQYMKRERDTK
ncbi:DNA polymerase iota [Macrosteles quadrilineatus]|uniref:DNA polymerase iota n=1 Tax=Macrosteles quadrilineatus TaxID=74068 RepID=UPI0023E1A4C7|nr:DNA polymerase iota [Macrosteles quadrilineatus]